MKIKSLLLVGLLMAATTVNATIVKNDANSKVYVGEAGADVSLGEDGTAVLACVLNHSGAPTLTTQFQFNITLTDGLDFAPVKGSNYCQLIKEADLYIEDEDMEVASLSAQVSGRSMAVVGVNMTKTPIPTNPSQICNIKIAKNDSFNAGSEKITFDDVIYNEKNAADPSGQSDPEWHGVKNEQAVLATAVENVKAGKAIANVKYVNAAGMESDQPFEGVNIVVTKYVDGTQKVAKVIK